MSQSAVHLSDPIAASAAGNAPDAPASLFVGLLRLVPFALVSWGVVAVAAAVVRTMLGN